MENLNESQKSFVQYRGNILLLASAGTGKTKAISAKILHLIEEKGMSPSSILCLSFTNKACEETKERLLSVVGKDALSATIKTFHSFCFEILFSEKRRNYGEYPEEVIFDEDDCLQIVNSLTSDTPEDILRCIDYVKDYRISHHIFSDDSIHDILAAGDEIAQGDTSAFEKLFRKGSSAVSRFLNQRVALLKDYQQALIDSHGLDFDDLVSGVYQLFLNQEVVERWKRKFSFIAIDEAQDTSMPEYELLEKLFGQSQIVISGDFFQTIYQWRGSNPQEMMRRFRKDYAPKSFCFDVNYRSTQILVEAEYGALLNIFGDSAKAFYPNGVTAYRREKGDLITAFSANSVDEEAAKILAKIHVLQKTYPLSRMCILTRSNKYGMQIADYFRKSPSDLKCFLIGDLEYYRRTEIKDVFAFLRLMINPHDAISASRIIDHYVGGVGPKTLEDLFGELKGGACLSLSDFLDYDMVKMGDPMFPLIDALDHGKVVVFDTETTGLDVNEDNIVQISAEKINENGHVINSFSRFIHPKKSVGDSYKIHGFTDQFLAIHGENSEIVLKDFLSFSEGCVLVGHNVSFDIGILKSELERNNLVSEKPFLSFDTYLLTQRIYPKGPKNYKLSYLSQDFFHFEHISSHNANDDVAATVELLMKMVKEKIIPGTMERQTIFLKYGRKFEKFDIALKEMKNNFKTMKLDELVQTIIATMRIKEHYRGETEKTLALDNLVAIAQSTQNLFLSSRESIQNFLNIAALSNTEIDALCKKKDMLPILTVHQSKGAEFDVVFVAGLSQGIFPNYYGNPEEEKRIFYVAISRAKEKLYLSRAEMNQNGYPTSWSSFLSYIPSESIDWGDQ